VAGARNIGILASSSDYVAFLDDDDLRLPGTLDKQVEALMRNKRAGFVCAQMLMADQEGRMTGEVTGPKSSGQNAFWELLELDFPVMPISVVIRKECFNNVGLLNSSLPGIDDWDVLVRIAELYPGPERMSGGGLCLDSGITAYRVARSTLANEILRDPPLGA
jgi:glycosyltransferase involved in cell wall biosynthesis